MKNPIAPYPGRQLFLGRTIEGSPCFAYLVTGRSPESQKRKAVRMGNKIVIGPLGDAAYDPLRHYTSLQYDDTAGIAAISNGIQTEAIFETYRLLDSVKSDPAPHYLEMIMEGAGHEPDSLRTPRISGIITRKNNNTLSFLSIKRHDKKAFVSGIDLKNGLMTGVSTYNGSLEAPLPFYPATVLPNLKFNATRASEIGGYLYDISAATNMGQDIRVCVVAGVFVGNCWDISLVNAN